MATCFPHHRILELEAHTDSTLVSLSESQSHTSFFVPRFLFCKMDLITVTPSETGNDWNGTKCSCLTNAAGEVMSIIEHPGLRPCCFQGWKSGRTLGDPEVAAL